MTQDVNKVPAVSTGKRTHRIDDEVINPSVERASTLPSEFYVDPKYQELERKKIFWRTWQIVGRAEQVSKPGDYFTANLCGEPLLIVRDQENKVRGFYNVCRHRAGPPADGCGSRKVFRCGYHGWTYGLDGRLVNAPEMDGTEDFRFEDFRLRGIRVGEWEGQVFVNLDENAGALRESLRELPKQSGKFRFGEMRLAGRRDYHMRCNWKVYIDNYLEGYHLPSVHPSLNRELDYNAYAATLFERHSLQMSPIRGPENEASVERRYKQASSDMAAEYYWIFPNWMLNCYPDNISLNIVLPTGPETCVAIFEWYFLPERMAAAEETIKFSDEIQVEDGRICETVHVNLKSQSYDRGRYSVKQEKCLHHFHRLYAETMGLG